MHTVAQILYMQPLLVSLEVKEGLHNCSEHIKTLMEQHCNIWGKLFVLAVNPDRVCMDNNVLEVGWGHSINNAMYNFVPGNIVWGIELLDVH